MRNSTVLAKDGKVRRLRYNNNTYIKNFLLGNLILRNCEFEMRKWEGKRDGFTMLFIV